MDPTYSGAKLHPADREIIRLRMALTHAIEGLEVICSLCSLPNDNTTRISAVAMLRMAQAKGMLEDPKP